MPIDSVFALASGLALCGWLALLASPWMPASSDRIAGYVLPVILSLGYLVLLGLYWPKAEGGFTSLAEVEKLFKTRELVLAGWVHYLAFDLFIGAWEVRTARAERIAFLWLLPCLALTFMFGPVGLLMFLAVRWAHGLRRALDESQT